METQIIKQTRGLANLALTVVAGKASTAINAFAIWFLAGFSAIAAWYASNVHPQAPPDHPAVIMDVTYLYLAVVGCCMLQRYLHTVISAAAESQKELVPLLQQFGSFDLEEYFLQLEKAFPLLWGYFVKKSTQALREGDLTQPGRMLLRLTLLQGIFTTAQMVVLLFLIYRALPMVNFN